jgi:hypothetical protein
MNRLFPTLAWSETIAARALCWLSIAVFLTLLGTCMAQERGGLDPRAAMPLVAEVLSKAQLSGSLEYSGRCEPHKVYPDFPQLRWPTRHDSSPLEFLQAMFDVDPYMRITQEADGKVRMIETDVPTDLLDIRIQHLSFFPEGAGKSDAVYGPRMALLAILKTPEVTTFGKAHEIEGLPYPDKLVMRPGDCCGGGRVVHGELQDITVSQALDYILKTFPGFWLYENCQRPEGGREVFFNFYTNSPATAYNRKAAMENN